MNYIQLINQYWELQREREDFTAQVQLLYFALLYFANKAGWKSFKKDREYVLDQAKISKDSYYKAREVLKNAGLISYEEGGNKLTKCEFTVLLLSDLKDSKQDSKPDTKPENKGVVSGLKDTTKDSKQDSKPDHTNKPINNKTNKHSDTEVSDASQSSAPGEKSEGENQSKENSDSLNADETKASHTGGAAAVPPEPEPPSYHRLFTDTYCAFYKKRVGVAPRFTKADGIAASALRDYLKSQCRGQTDEGAQKSLEYIFQHWNRLDSFLQDQLTLTQINKNINNILNQVRNGAAKNNNSGRKAANGANVDAETAVALSRALASN